MALTSWGADGSRSPFRAALQLAVSSRSLQYATFLTSSQRDVSVPISFARVSLPTLRPSSILSNALLRACEAVRCQGNPMCSTGGVRERKKEINSTCPKSLPSAKALYQRLSSDILSYHSIPYPGQKPLLLQLQNSTQRLINTLICNNMHPQPFFTRISITSIHCEVRILWVCMQRGQRGAMRDRNISSKARSCAMSTARSYSAGGLRQRNQKLHSVCGNFGNPKYTRRTQDRHFFSTCFSPVNIV